MLFTTENTEPEKYKEEFNLSEMEEKVELMAALTDLKTRRGNTAN